MPEWTYCNKDETIVESKFFLVGEKVPEFIYKTVDGKRVRLDKDFTLTFGQPGRQTCKAGLWPRESDTAGVQPHQIAEAQAHDAELGVSADYNQNTGAVVFTDKAHEKRYCQAHKIYQRNAGYSDATPRNK